MLDYDFVKKIQPLKQDTKYFFTITENRYASLFQITNDKEQYFLNRKVTQRFGNYIYDVETIQNFNIDMQYENNMDFIAVSTKDTPVYKALANINNDLGPYL